MPYANYNEQLRRNRERQKTPEGAAAHARALKAYRQRNRKKLAAHNAVAKALLRGHMEKWPVCALSACDLTEVEAHHADYDNPLGVVWLCAAHHKQAHALGKQLLSTTTQ